MLVVIHHQLCLVQVVVELALLVRSVVLLVLVLVETVLLCPPQLYPLVMEYLDLLLDDGLVVEEAVVSMKVLQPPQLVVLVVLVVVLLVGIGILHLEVLQELGQILLMDRMELLILVAAAVVLVVEMDNGLILEEMVVVDL